MTAVFSIELILKVIAKGFVLGKRAYLRDPWNILDLVVVVVGLIDVAVDLVSRDPTNRILMRLKVLRTLP